MMSNLDTKTLKKSRNRWLMFAQIGFSYEAMQASSVLYALAPSLRRIYGDQRDLLRNSYNTHLQFFNTQPWMGGLILGSALAIEEQEKEEALEVVSSLKTSLMGPFAGLGDSLFFVLPKTIFGAIAGYMAIEGSAMGLLICLAAGLFMLAVRFKLWDLGYKQGVKFITTMQNQLSLITNAASVLGLTVIGALVATMVKVNLTLAINVGEATTTLQSMFDKFMPNILPLLVTVACYKLLGVKKMTSAKLVIIVILVSIVLAALKIVG